MKLSEAKLLIRGTFKRATPDAFGTSSVFASISDSETIDTFLALERGGTREFVRAGDDVKMFLWEAFRRFTVASYPGIVSAGEEVAPQILQAFALADGEKSGRTARLRASTLKRRAAVGFGYKLNFRWPEADPLAFLAEVDEIETTLQSVSKDDLALGDVERARGMITGLNDDVRSTLRFSLPHPLLRREAVISLEYEGLAATLTIRPDTSTTTGMSAVSDQPAAIEAISPGAWSVGHAEIEVVVRGLIDWTASVSKYEIGDGPGTESPALGWLAADIVRATLTSLATTSPDELLGQWLPLPGDVRNIYLAVGTDGAPDAYHTVALPMVGARVTVLDSASVTVELGLVASPHPWEAARAYALGAMTSGRTFDAVVWANVAIEAFVDERLQDLSNMPGVDREALLAKTSVFGDAEDIVSEQFPELAGKVKWPDIEKAPSRYRQITAIAKMLPLNGSAKQLTSAYSKVADHRNDAVHGRTIDAIAPSDAEAAFVGLETFIQLFEVQEGKPAAP